jgi:hypothetical protein
MFEFDVPAGAKVPAAYSHDGERRRSKGPGRTDLDCDGHAELVRVVA